MRSTARTSAAAALGLALLVGCSSGTPEPDPSTTGPSGSTDTTASTPDFDGDGSADLVVGIGEAPSRVTVQYGSGTTLDLRRTDLDGIASNTFGRALHARDLDRDGITDLIITDPTPGGAGLLFVLLGSAEGLDPSSVRTVTAPSGVASFGASVALVESPSLVLAVGAPGDTGADRPGGSVVTWTLGDDGLPEGDAIVLTQDSAGMPGGGKAGDGFGTTVAATGSHLAVAAPRRDTNGVRDSGAVFVVDQPTGTPSVHELAVGVGGVPGEAKAEDRFGFSMTAGDDYLVVGSPMRDEGAQNNGVVHPFRLGSGAPEVLDAIRPMDAADAATQGLLFGFSVAMAHPCVGVPGVLVGAPAAATGDVPLTGAAWLIPLAEGCTARKLVEGEALGGSPTEMASLGLTVSASTARAGQADTLMLAAPGNSEEGVAGRVLVLDPDSDYSGPARAVVTDLRLHEEGAITMSPPIP